MIRPRDWSLKVKLICAGLLAQGLTVGVLIFGFASRIEDYMRDDLELRAQQLRPVLQAALAAPIAQRDYATVQQILYEVASRDGLVYLIVADPSGSRIASEGWSETDRLPAPTDPVPIAGASASRWHAFDHVLNFDGHVLGKLYFGLSTSAIDEAASALYGIGARVGLLASIVFTILLTGLGILLARPLERLTRASQSIRAGAYDVALPRVSRDEVGTLAESFAHMAAEIKDRIRSLTDREAQLALAKEQAETANFAKSKFLTIVSHEVRTPLNGVLGILQTLQASPMTEEQRESLRIAHESGIALLALLSAILDFSQAEANELRLEKVSFNAWHEVLSVISLLRSTAVQKGLTLESRFEPSGDVYVRGDPRRFRQILTNIIANAVKFTDRGAITVAATAKPVKSGALELCIAVGDSGIGIAPNQIERIFEPFVQGDDSITRRFGGVGLGLPIAKQLVEAMGGTIMLKSTLGEGSTFTLLLTLEPGGPAEAAQAASSSTHFTPPQQFGFHTLIVDDNKVNLKVAERMIKLLGCTYSIANDGREALESLQTEHFDLLLMDLQMPVMGGIEAIERYRKLESQHRSDRLPAIAVTAHALSEERERAIRAGFDGFVTKPVKLAELESAIADVASRKPQAPTIAGKFQAAR